MGHPSTFADDAVILPESPGIFVLALKAMVKKAESLKLQAYRAKTKIQTLGGLLDNTVEYVHACG